MDNDMEKDLNAAFDLGDKEENEDKEVVEIEVEKEAPEEEESEAPEEEESEAPEEEGEEGEEEERPLKEVSEKKPAKQEAAVERPPQSWKAAAREEWKKVPDSVRKEILRRESDMQKGLEQGAAARKFGDAFAQTIAPFQQFIAADHSTPLDAVRNLMSTAATLRVGTAQQKARVAYEIISNFGIDIDMLDNMLASKGQQAGAGAADPNIERLIEQRLAPMQEVVQRYKRDVEVQQQETTRAISSEIDSFANDSANEFYEDVRADMADLLTITAQRGQAMSMKEAYERACYMNPEISAVLLQRKRAEQAKNGELKKKKVAASSVSGAPTTGSPGKKKALTIEDDIKSAMESLADSR